MDPILPWKAKFYHLFLRCCELTDFVFNRFSVTVEDTVKASTTVATTTAATTTTPTTSPPPATSFYTLSSVTSSSAAVSPTEATVLHAAPSSTASNSAPQSSIAAQPTPRLPSSHTQQPTAGMDTPTKPTTLKTETSAGTLVITTAQHITTTFTPTTPSKSTEALQTTRKQIGRGTTELLVTTSPTAVRSTKAPTPAPSTRLTCFFHFVWNFLTYEARKLFLTFYSAGRDSFLLAMTYLLCIPREQCWSHRKPDRSESRVTISKTNKAIHHILCWQRWRHVMLHSHVIRQRVDGKLDVIADAIYNRVWFPNIRVAMATQSAVLCFHLLCDI